MYEARLILLLVHPGTVLFEVVQPRPYLASRLAHLGGASVRLGSAPYLVDTLHMSSQVVGRREPAFPFTVGISAFVGLLMLLHVFPVRIVVSFERSGMKARRRAVLVVGLTSWLLITMWTLPWSVFAA